MRKVICDYCKKEYYKKSAPSKITKYNFCCRKHYNLWKNKYPKEIIDKFSKSHLGKSWGKHSEETRKKMSQQKQGKNNHNWKGGRFNLKQQIRECYKYKIWRSNVFQRDNWTCQTCGKRGGYLCPHHLKSFAIILDEYNIKTLEQAIDCKELWNIDNGVALCCECHKLTKNYGGKNKKRGNI